MARESAPLGAAAGAAVLRARVGAAQVEVPGDFAIEIREMWEGAVTAAASRKRSWMWRAQRRAVNRPKEDTRRRRCMLNSWSWLVIRSSRARTVLGDEVADDVEVGRAVCSFPASR